MKGFTFRLQWRIPTCSFFSPRPNDAWRNSAEYYQKWREKKLFHFCHEITIQIVCFLLAPLGQLSAELCVWRHAWFKPRRTSLDMLTIHKKYFWSRLIVWFQVKLGTICIFFLAFAGFSLWCRQTGWFEISSIYPRFSTLGGFRIHCIGASLYIFTCI